MGYGAVTVEVLQLQFIVGLGMHQIEIVLITVEAPQLPSRLGFVQLDKVLFFDMVAMPVVVLQ